jgi:hypothetical protein
MVLAARSGKEAVRLDLDQPHGQDCRLEIHSSQAVAISRCKVSK